MEKVLKTLNKISEDRKITIRINNEFAVYTTAGKLINDLKEKGTTYFEDGCYDIFLYLKSKNTIGWYKRYGLLSLNNKISVFFRDGDNWKIYEDEVSNIPYYFHNVEEKNEGFGFYNLQKEALFPEEEFEETYNCYYFETIHQIEIKEFETGNILVDLGV